MATSRQSILFPALAGILPALLAGPTTADTLDAGGPVDGAANPRPTTSSGLLVPAGETIRDIDKIIEALDRRAPVTAVAFSPDGRLIASGCEDHMVRVWQIETRRLVRRLAGHSSVVTAVAFSPDGSVIASASNDRTVRLWDARSGQLLRTLRGHVYHVYAVAFDPQRRYLATASWDRTIDLWDAKSGDLVKKLRGHGAAIRAIDFSRDGKLLASGSDDKTVRLWNVDTGKELKVLTGHAAAVNAVRFGSDRGWLFSGSSDHTVRMWRLRNGAIVRKLGDCSAPVLSLALSANGQILGGGCGASGSVLWDVSTGAELRRGRGHTGETRAIAFSPDGRMVATGGDDASILIEDVATGHAVASLSARVAHLEAVAFGPDGHMLATASRDRRVLIWRDEGDHKVLDRVLLGEQGPLRTLAFSPDGKVLAAGEGQTVALWDLAGGETIRRLTGHDGAVNAVAFTPGGHTLVSAGDDATLRLWNFERDAAAEVLKGHRAPVHAVAVSPDGKLLASASDDGTARVWDAVTGRGLAVLGSHHGPVTSVAFSSDGKYLVTGSQDRTVNVWLTAKRKLLKAMRKELPAGVVALVARGQQIATASSDGVLSLWELADDHPVRQSTGNADAPSALAVAPDGATFASASRDGVLRIWDGKTLGRRWSLAGSSRKQWLACNDAETCWRNEDGTLLGRVNGQGARVPVPPSDDAHRTALAASVDRSKLGGTVDLAEGRAVSIPIRIETRGRYPAYWVNVIQPMMPASASRGALLLIPPPTIRVLAPGASADVVCEVSALEAYENPQPRSETLRLSISSASAPAPSLEVPVSIDAPQLKLRYLTLLRGTSEAVMASMTQVTMADLQPVLLQGSLTLEDGSRASIAPVAIEQPFIGQDLALAFPLPTGIELDRHSRVTFTLRKSTHPAHVWTFAHSPVRIPLPLSLWALLAGSVLGLGLVIWRTRLFAHARLLVRVGKRFVRLAMAVLLGLGKGLMALVRFRSTARSLRARLQRRGIAVTFFRLQPETQCSHLARQLGASWAPLDGARQPVFELHLGREVPLNLDRCLLAFPTGDTLAATLAELETTDEGPGGITVVLSDVPRSELAERLPAPRRLVVLGKAGMNRILRAPRPALAFAQAASEQVDRAAVSLYRSALSCGQRQPFHGRKSELRRLTGQPRKNHLIIGPHGIGKTSLLDEIHRRFHAHPGIECHYLSLADGDLTTALADALDMPGERLLDILLERLADRPEGTRAVVLCDDADEWATRDAAHGGAQLQTLALLSQEHACSFVLAGFLGLLYAVRPVRGRKRFGDVVRLESLDADSCADLATEPMAALNVRYAKADLVEHIARQSGGMPSLLVAICDQVVDGLQPDQRIIERTQVESACQSEAVARAITAWRPRFGLPEPRFATLDQAVMLSAVFKTRFTLEELQSTLAGLGVQATAAEIRHSADRLVAACVFEHWLGHFNFRVPLFQTVMQEATLARMIAQLNPGESP
jgi:WD40 repeat protein